MPMAFCASSPRATLAPMPLPDIGSAVDWLAPSVRRTVSMAMARTKSTKDTIKRLKSGHDTKIRHVQCCTRITRDL